MNDRSATLRRPTTEAMPRSTSLPALASGLPLLEWLDGPTTGASAQSLAPASRSAPRERDWVLPIPGTSGRTPSGSLASCGLTSSLVSRLQQRATGSILWRLTWKASVTPSGRPLFRLQASGAPISDNAFTGWPTPTTPSGGQTVPPGTTATGRKPDGSKAQVTLESVARLSGWKTPRVSDFKGGLYPDSSSTRVFADFFLADQANHVIGFNSRTGDGVRLNPALPRWLLRIPARVDACAPTATRSTSKRRPTS